MAKKKNKYIKGWYTANGYKHYFEDGYKSVCGKVTRDAIGTKGHYFPLHMAVNTPICKRCVRSFRKKENRGRLPNTEKRYFGLPRK
jgi:hypothetical protein